MVQDIAVEKGSISGDAHGDEVCWRLATEDGSVVAVSYPDWTLSFSSNIMSAHNFQFITSSTLF